MPQSVRADPRDVRTRDRAESSVRVMILKPTFRRVMMTGVTRREDIHRTFAGLACDNSGRFLMPRSAYVERGFFRLTERYFEPV